MLKNWEVSILGADQKDRGLGGRERLSQGTKANKYHIWARNEVGGGGGVISVKRLMLRFQADINFITRKQICKIVVILINKQVFPLISCSSRLFVFL